MNNLNSLRVIDLNFSNDPAPVSKINPNKSWVYWGANNLYPQYLLNLFNARSTTHKAIINRKVKMIAGGGIKRRDNESIQFKEFINNVWGNYNLDQLVVKMAFDLEIFGGVVLNPIWNGYKSYKLSGIKRVCSLNYIPFERWRQNKENSNDGLPNYHWISNDWKNVKVEPEKFQEFSEKYDKKNLSQIYIATIDQQGIKWYPEPNYSPVVNWLEAEWEIGNFNRASIQNGFNAGFILNFASGIPTEEEMDRAYENMRVNFVGSGNANKFLLSWSNGTDGRPSLEAIPNNGQDGKYLQLQETIRQNIFVAHEITNPQVLGVFVPGSLGGRSEQIEGLATFQSAYINSRQKIIEDTLNKFARLYGVPENETIELNKYVLDIPEAAPQLNMSDILSLIEAVKTGKVDAVSAANILTTVYEIHPDRAQKILNSPIEIKNILN